ncbi:MAG: choice-of-anchor J domain-containing protein, partial [Deltaproteobacteria bacterium]|nr:choice-of-anchor J domain-containing protein [Deltaproteobacteria bacterium]
MARNKLFWGFVILGIFFLSFSTASAGGIETVLSEDFEDGWGDWDADNGVWDVGVPDPDVGPGSAHGGVGEEEIYLQFWHWFSYAGNFNCDTGHIQISVQDEDTGVWSNWTSIDNIIGHTSPWSKMGVDLTAYAGNRVRIAFYHTARGDNSYPDYCGASSSGWYIDDIEIIKKLPEFTGDFESGWQDWSADRGVWQIGTPTAGPEECHSGLQCAGTVLDGNYPANTDSRLISPSINLPHDEEIYLRFWHWFSYAGGGHCDVGYIQVSVWDEGTGEWSNWTNIGNPVTDSSPWSRRREDLT